MFLNVVKRMKLKTNLVCWIWLWPVVSWSP